MDSLFDLLIFLTEVAERRRVAVFMLGMSIAVLSALWYVALWQHDSVMQVFRAVATAGPPTYLGERTLRGVVVWGLLAILLAAPFVGVIATWNLAVPPQQQGDTEAVDVMAGYVAEQRSDRQRRILLTAAFATVFNALALLLVS